MVFFRHTRCNLYLFDHRHIFYFKIRRLWTESGLTITLRLCCNILISPPNLNRIHHNKRTIILISLCVYLRCFVYCAVNSACVSMHERMCSSIQAIKTRSIAHKRYVRVHYICINDLACSLFSPGKTHFETH